MTRSALEERIYRSQFASGLLEVFVGFGLILIGAAWLTGHVVLGAIVPALLALMWPGVRKRFLAPRAGHVMVRADRRRRERRGLLIMVFIGVFALAAVVAALLVAVRGSYSLAANDFSRALPALIVAVGACLAAVLFGVRRTLFYAIPLVLSAVLCVVLRIEPGWSLLGSGVVILLAGAMLLFDFARKTSPRGTE